MLKSLAIAAALALALLGGMLATEHRTVEGKCQPYSNDQRRIDDGNPYWDGWERSPGGTVEGVRAWILNYSPWVQPGRFSTAWSMLNQGPSYWAQVGWWEYAYDDRRTFVQWTDGPNHYLTSWFDPYPVLTPDWYRVLYDGNPNFTLRFEVNDVQLWQTWGVFTPTTAQTYGEISSLASQMPGAVTEHEWMYGSKYKKYGTWYSFNTVPITTAPGYFGNYSDSPHTVEIWDKACP